MTVHASILNTCVSTSQALWTMHLKEDIQRQQREMSDLDHSLSCDLCHVLYNVQCLYSVVSI